ncbi:TetR/AcrR family transcriptional regulator [Tistrella mobilis]|uniref:TetR/AcrR family transcriptional regulator n=1 Tax=Tistrella mobilis TaxID=171437 RepID=UPI003556E519
MSEIATAIMDAAERRIRQSGYNGFSFREIASDVGVKSSSVHYHFPTKERLAAAVARRYTERFAEMVQGERERGARLKEAWRSVFRRALSEDGRMCLCGALATNAGALPDEVNLEARHFFTTALQSLAEAGMSHDEAVQMLATLEGAMLLAGALDDVNAFDLATSSLG